MADNDRCLGCMSDKGDEEICSNCGWNHDMPTKSPVFLPLGTILEGKYLIGRALGQGGFG